MELSQAKEIILRECNRERRIVTRNMIVIGILAVAVLTVVVIYLLPSLAIYTGKAVDEINSNSNFSTYYKWIIPIGFALSVLYPLIALIKVFRRQKNVLKAFGLIAKTGDTTIVTEHTMHLTIVPLPWVRLHLDPVTYLEITVNNNGYSLPVNEHMLPDIKRVLSNANMAFYQDVMSEIYGEKHVSVSCKEAYPVRPLQDFQQFAHKEFSADMAVMEKGRSKNKGMMYFQFLFALAFMGAVIQYASSPDAIRNSADIFKFIGGFIVVSSLLSFGFYLYAKKNTSGPLNYTQFKKSVFSRSVHYINPEFEYIEKAHVGLPELLHARLFENKTYTISGGDQIIGHHNGVPFQSCNLTVTYRPGFRSEKEPDDMVFSGNYFVAHFPKKFRSAIFIHPKKGIFSNIRDNDIRSYLQVDDGKIRLEDPDFQKQFEVYCDDQILARYILTPSFMERLKAINIRNKGNVYITINESNIVIATNRVNATDTGNSLYGMMFTKIDMRLLEEIYTELTEQLSMIDTLKLNNEIWKN